MPSPSETCCCHHTSASPSLPTATAEGGAKAHAETHRPRETQTGRHRSSQSRRQLKQPQRHQDNESGGQAGGGQGGGKQEGTDRKTKSSHEEGRIKCPPAYSDAPRIQASTGCIGGTARAAQGRRRPPDRTNQCGTRREWHSTGKGPAQTAPERVGGRRAMAAASTSRSPALLFENARRPAYPAAAEKSTDTATLPPLVT